MIYIKVLIVKMETINLANFIRSNIMNDRQLIRLLKVFIVIGILLISLGHYLLSYSDITTTYGVSGVVISASCIAFGLVLSLPTKMYLTFVLMKRESEESD